MVKTGTAMAVLTVVLLATSHALELHIRKHYNICNYSYIVLIIATGISAYDIMYLGEHYFFEPLQ